MEYLSVYSPNAGKCGPEKLRIRTIFTQWVFPLLTLKKEMPTRLFLQNELPLTLSISITVPGAEVDLGLPRRL